VVILGPTPDSTVSGTVQISVSASDNVAVAQVRCYVDNKLLGSTTRSSLSFSWNTIKASQGADTISATAEDTSSYVATAGIQVTVAASTTSGSNGYGKGGKWKLYGEHAS
jgi:hypothetical protein